MPSVWDGLLCSSDGPCREPEGSGCSLQQGTLMNQVQCELLKQMLMNNRSSPDGGA